MLTWANPNSIGFVISFNEFQFNPTQTGRTESVRTEFKSLYQDYSS